MLSVMGYITPMKRLKLLIIALLLGSFWIPQVTIQAADQGRILHPKGLLWKIEKPGQPASHIFGTMHVGDPRVINLAPEAERAFKNADRFAMEVLMNFQAMGAITSGSYFNDGRTLASVMDGADYDRLIQLLQQQRGLPESAVKHMRPWVVIMILMMPADGQLGSGDALDMVLYRRAALRSIPLLGLETAEEQIAIFDTLSIDEQVWMLNKSVADFELIDGLLAQMLDAYLAGDLAALMTMQRQYDDPESDIDNRLMLAMLDQRNLRMVERMQHFLQQGNAFIAIGALHLPGERGVLHLLEKSGYSVTPVY